MKTLQLSIIAIAGIMAIGIASFAAIYNAPQEMGVLTIPNLSEDGAIRIVKSDLSKLVPNLDRVHLYYKDAPNPEDRKIPLPLFYEKDGTLFRINNTDYSIVGRCTPSKDVICPLNEKIIDTMHDRLVYVVDLAWSDKDGQSFPDVYVVDATNGDILFSSISLRIRAENQPESQPQKDKIGSTNVIPADDIQTAYEVWTSQGAITVDIDRLTNIVLSVRVSDPISNVEAVLIEENQKKIIQTVLSNAEVGNLIEGKDYLIQQVRHSGVGCSACICPENGCALVGFSTVKSQHLGVGMAVILNPETGEVFDISAGQEWNQD